MYVIRKNYAIKNSNISGNDKKGNIIPLKQDNEKWNIYKVGNKFLNGKQDNKMHGGLLIDEINKKVLLVEITHSPMNGKRKNYEIRNLKSTDLDKQGNLRKSYLKKKLVYLYENQNGINLIDKEVLKGKINDLKFTVQEKKDILRVLNNLETTKDKYIDYEKKAKKKNE